MAKKYYAVAYGRQRGIYTTWDECNNQIRGWSNALFKSFPTLKEAQQYLEYHSKYVRTNYPESKDSFNNDIKDNKRKKVSEKKYKKYLKNIKDNVESIKMNSDYLDNEYGVENAGANDIVENNDNESETLHIYVDGSYSTTKKVASYGFVIVYCDNIIYTNSGRCRDYISMRNIAGELDSVIKSLQIVNEKIRQNYEPFNSITNIIIYHDYIGIANYITGAWKANKYGTKEYILNFNTQFKNLQVKNTVKVDFKKVKAHTGNRYNEAADRVAKSALNGCN